jgi:glutathione S-transferase
MSQEHTLYYAPGTCARVPLIALEEIGKPFQTRLVAFMRGDNRHPDFLALNPAGKVPLLVTAHGPIAQNIAILAFLAKSNPSAGLLPRASSPFEEAQVLAKLSRFSADLHPIVTRIVLPRFFAQSPAAQAQVREQAEDAMRFYLQSFEDTLEPGLWLLGERWSILDAYLGWVWFRITGAGFPAESFPRIAKHSDRLLSRPSVVRALAIEAQAQSELEAQGLAIAGLKNR